MSQVPAWCSRRLWLQEFQTSQLAEGLPEPGARRGLAKAGARAGPGNLLDKDRLTLSHPCYVTQKQ